MARQPAPVLATWIQQRLESLRQTRVPHLARLCARLQSEVFERDNAPLARAVTALHAAGRQLHFLPLRQGWLARLLGRDRKAHDRFVVTCEHIVACAAPVKAQLLALEGHGQERPAAARRTMTELEAQRQQLAAEVDQGVTWLQEMCTQLAGTGVGSRADSPLESLVQAAQLFTQEFKRLESVGAITREVVMRGNTVLQRRGALLVQVRSGLDSFDQTWTVRLGSIVGDLKAGRHAAPSIPKAIEAHDDLMKRLAAAVDGCGALRHEEQLLEQHLALLHAQLRGPQP